MIVLNHPQGSDDWLRARVGVCTASRFTDALDVVGGLTDQQQKYVDALLAGASESAALRAAGYKAKPTAEAVARALEGESLARPGAKAITYAWLIAIETIAREPLDDTFVTYAMKRGRELEPVARAVYEQRTGCLVEEVSLILTDDELFGYSSDGFRDDDGLIEIKCPMACDKLGEVWAHPERAHLEYLDQMQGGLWITGRKYCDLAVYCPWLASVGKDLFVKRIYRDEAAIERMELALLDFRKIVDGFLEILRTPARMSGKPKDGPTVPPAEAVAAILASAPPAAPPPPWDDAEMDALALPQQVSAPPPAAAPPAPAARAALPANLFA